MRYYDKNRRYGINQVTNNGLHKYLLVYPVELQSPIATKFYESLDVAEANLKIIYRQGVAQGLERNEFYDTQSEDPADKLLALIKMVINTEMLKSLTPDMRQQIDNVTSSQMRVQAQSFLDSLPF